MDKGQYGPIRSQAEALLRYYRMLRRVGFDRYVARRVAQDVFGKHGALSEALGQIQEAASS